MTPVCASSMAIPYDRRDNDDFDEVVKDVPAISGEVAVDHLDDQAAVGLHHERREVPVRDDVADERLVEVGADLGEINFPETSSPVDLRIGAPDTVHEHVEPSRLIPDAGGEACHFLLARVVDPHGDGTAAGLLDHRDGLADRLGPIHASRVPRGAAPGAIDDRTGLCERSRNATSGTARRSCHQCHLAGQAQPFYRHVRRLSHPF